MIKVDNYVFKDSEKEEATLMRAVIDMSKKYGISANEMNHIYPVILRILKSKSDWAK